MRSDQIQQDQVKTGRDFQVKYTTKIRRHTNKMVCKKLKIVK